jgi:hypothetical protein
MDIVETTREMYEVLMPHVEVLNVTVSYFPADPTEEEYNLSSGMVKEMIEWEALIKIDAYTNSHLMAVMNYFDCHLGEYAVYEDNLMYTVRGNRPCGLYYPEL